jgi:hypothetical protein
VLTKARGSTSAPAKKKTSQTILSKMFKEVYSKSKDRTNNIDNYELDKELSGQRVTVYHNKDTGHTVINHKGTSGIHDWITDLRLGLGDKSSNRFKHPVSALQTLAPKHKNNITVTNKSINPLEQHSSGTVDALEGYNDIGVDF